MPCHLSTSAVFAAAMLAPLAAAAQENSIMQSFHPEKYPAAATEPGKQTEPDHAKDAAAAAAPEKTERAKSKE